MGTVVIITLEWNDDSYFLWSTGLFDWTGHPWCGECFATGLNAMGAVLVQLASGPWWVDSVKIHTVYNSTYLPPRLIKYFSCKQWLKNSSYLTSFYNLSIFYLRNQRLYDSFQNPLLCYTLVQFYNHINYFGCEIKILDLPCHKKFEIISEIF